MADLLTYGAARGFSHAATARVTHIRPASLTSLTPTAFAGTDANRLYASIPLRCLLGLSLRFAGGCRGCGALAATGGW